MDFERVQFWDITHYPETHPKKFPGEVLVCQRPTSHRSPAWTAATCTAGVFSLDVLPVAPYETLGQTFQSQVSKFKLKLVLKKSTNYNNSPTWTSQFTFLAVPNLKIPPKISNLTKLLLGSTRYVHWIEVEWGPEINPKEASQYPNPLQSSSWDFPNHFQTLSRADFSTPATQTPQFNAM